MTAALAKYWREATIAALLVALGFTLLFLRNEHTTRIARDATIESIHQQTITTARRYEAKAKIFAAQAKSLQKVTSNEIANINADRDAALDELRARPGRGTPATTTTIAGACSTPLGGTGAFLFREDAQFLTREAARSDGIRVALKGCYAQYDAAREMLAEER